MPNYNPLSNSGRNKATAKPKNAKNVLKNLARYIMRYKGKFILAIFLSLSSSLFSLIGPLLSGKCIDAISLEGGVNFHDVYLYVILLIFFYAISAILSYILSLVMQNIAQNIGDALRNDIFKHLKKLPVSFYDSHQSGDIISIISYDVNTVATSLSTDVVSIASAAVNVIGSFIMMLIIMPILTLVFVVTIPISFMITKRMSKKSKKLFHMRSVAYGSYSGYSEERISGIRSIKAYGREEEILNQFDEYNDLATNKAYDAEYYSSKTGPFVNFINNISLAFIAVFGALLYLYKWMSIGQIGSFVQYSRKFSGPINETLNLFAEIQSALAAGERIFALLDEKVENFNQEPLYHLESVEGDVSFNHVQFSYNKERKILKDLSFHAKKGTMTAIVGPTGAGKTTIINLLMKFYIPQDGTVLLDNVDINHLPSDELRRYYSMVLQDSFLFKGTIKENIAYGNEGASDEEIINAAKLAHADSFIQKMKDGYNEVISEEGGSLSKGQKQLITIARAFLSKSHMLILDEATSSVDTRTERRIQDAMQNLMQGKTCFVIAHRLSTIRNADLILVVLNGDIVEQGNHESLIKKKGVYYTLHQSQYE